MKFLSYAVLAFIAGAAVVQASEFEWPIYGGDVQNHRFSQATQINTRTVASLEKAWHYDTGIDSVFQATPIVKDRVMYVSLPYNDVVALDAVTGEKRWRYQHDLNESYPICCGPANRGVAVAQGKVFMGTIDARLLALDAQTGEKLWDIQVVTDNTGVQEDAGQLNAAMGRTFGASGAGINMVPVVFEDTVIVGISGVGYGLHLHGPDPAAPLGAVVGIAGQYGRRGFVAAFQMDTGQKVWQFDTIAAEGWEGDFVTETADGIKLPRDIDAEKAAMSRYPFAWRYGGASAWSTPVIDLDTGILHFGTGNPSPQMQGASRPGDNLYSSSLVAVDASNGGYRWHYQQVPHDNWGYDVASPPVLFDITVHGQRVPAIGQAGKTGWFYVHDRRTGRFLYKSEAFVPQHNMFTNATREGEVIYPGVMGGANWSPAAVNPRLRTAYVAASHWPVEYKLHTKVATAIEPALEYATMSPLDTDERHGLLSAINIDTGKILWQIKTANPLLGGVLATAGNLVFTGEGKGELMAFHAQTGEKLWSDTTQAGVNAPPITYQIDGRQYIAVAVGGNNLFGFKTGQILQVWALP